MKDLSRFKAPFIDISTIRETADEFRKQFGKGKMPVDIEDIIEFDLNIDIVPKEKMYSACSANALISSDCRSIYIDYEHYWNSHNRPMMRFSLAHETGHYILHKNILPIIRSNSIAEWKNIFKTIPEKEYGWCELHAYEFAGRLLVPIEKLINELEKQKDNINLIFDRFPAINDQMVIDQVAVKIAKAFDVSDDVISRRIKFEGIWNQSDYR